MTLVSTLPAISPDANHTNATNDFSISSDTVVRPDTDVKHTGNTNGLALQELFEQTLTEKGEQGAHKIKWIGENEIQVDGLSGMTLHNFLLKAEAMGKKVIYRRSIVFRIED